MRQVALRELLFIVVESPREQHLSELLYSGAQDLSTKQAYRSRTEQAAQSLTKT
jgi:hypothetical protein